MDEIEILRRVLKYDTRGGKTRDLVTFLEKEFRQLGYDTQIIEHDDEMWNLIVRTGEYDRLVYNVHLDVVAFVSEYFDEDDKYIYAPGAVDTKTSAAALLVVFKRIREKIPPNITLAFDFDEETYGYGIQEIKKNLRKVKYFIAAEPTDFKITDFFSENMDLFLEIYGKETHPSIVNMEGAISRFVDLGCELKRRFDYISFISVVANEEGLYKKPKVCKAYLQIRNNRRFGKERILSILEEINKDIKIEKYEYDKLLDNRNSEIAKYLEESLRRNGIKPEREIGHGWSNVYAFEECDYIEFGPGDPELSHTNWEGIAKSDYLKLIDILTDFFQRVRNIVQ